VEPMMTFALGMVMGIIIAMTSVGGGIIMVPILLHAGIGAVYAIGANFFFVLTVKSISAIKYYRMGEVDIHSLKPMLASAGIGLVSGLCFLWWLTTYYPGDVVESAIVGLLTIAILLSAGMYAGNELAHLSQRVGRGKWLVTLSGLLTGFITQTTSVGSGVFTLMMLSRHFESPHKLIGTNMVFSLVIMLVAAIGYLSVGKVDVLLTMMLIGGGAPGMMLGWRMSQRLTERQHRAVLTLTIGLSVLLMLMKVLGKVLG